MDIGCPGDRGRGDSIGIADRTDSIGIVYSRIVDRDRIRGHMEIME